MELTGEHRIPASRDAVWAALHDPAILKECITGCQSMEMTGPDRLVAKVLAKVGPVKATFDADVGIENSVAPQSYTLVGEGKGGVAGFAKGSADVQLVEDGGDTILTYQANAKVGGKLAQLGSRLVDTTAKKYAADFFAALSEKLGAAPRTEATPAEPAMVAPVPTAAASAPPTPVAPPSAAPVAAAAMTDAAAARGMNGWLWGTVSFVAVILVLIALS